MACITSEQIRIFAKFRGDADGIERVGSAAERNAISQSTWIELVGFRQKIALLDKGFLSDRAVHDLHRELQDRLCNATAVRELLDLVKSLETA
jgi:hypothetical protein